MDLLVVWLGLDVGLAADSGVGCCYSGPIGLCKFVIHAHYACALLLQLLRSTLTLQKARRAKQQGIY